MCLSGHYRCEFVIALADGAVGIVARAHAGRNMAWAYGTNETNLLGRSAGRQHHVAMPMGSGQGSHLCTHLHSPSGLMSSVALDMPACPRRQPLNNLSGRMCRQNGEGLLRTQKTQDLTGLPICCKATT